MAVVNVEAGPEIQRINDKDDSEKTDPVLTPWRIILTVGAAFLIALSAWTSEDKQCELEIALKYINLEYTSHLCNYNVIRLHNLAWIISTVFFVFNTLALFLRCFDRITPKTKLYSFLVLAFVLPVLMTIIYIALSAKYDQQYVEYGDLQSEMLRWLEKTYASDDFNSSSTISTKWNEFFVKYDCCAVREVEGTSNDFDNTPWCTTSGSCQATSSQIPKACCKDVTKDDYTNAPNSCHASVNPGTFRPSCISRMRELDTVYTNETRLTILMLASLGLGFFQFAEAIIIIRKECWNKKPHKKDNTEGNEDNQTSSEKKGNAQSPHETNGENAGKKKENTNEKRDTGENKKSGTKTGNIQSYNAEIEDKYAKGKEGVAQNSQDSSKKEEKKEKTNAKRDMGEKETHKKPTQKP